MLNFTIKQLFFCNSYLGYSKKVWNKDMSLFVLGSRYNICFLNLTYIYFLLRKTFSLLDNINLKKQSIYIIVPNIFKNYMFISFFKKLNDSFMNITIINNWVFGTITNFKKINYPLNKVIYSNVFRKIPNILIMVDLTNLMVLQESFKYTILSLGFADTKDNPYSLDYIVPSNNTSHEVLVFFFKLILMFLYSINLKFKLLFFDKILNFKLNYIYSNNN